MMMLEKDVESEDKGIKVNLRVVEVVEEAGENEDIDLQEISKN